jgi:hypothetical protein
VMKLTTNAQMNPVRPILADSFSKADGSSVRQHSGKPHVSGSCHELYYAVAFFFADVLLLFLLAILALYSRMCWLIFSLSTFVNGRGST